MANPRKPAAVADATGAAIKNPQRYRNRSKPAVRKVGQPYKRMTEPAQEYWHQYVDEFPWLASSDRAQLRLLCELSADRDASEDFPIGKMNMMRQILNSFGGSPADRSRVHAPEEEDADPAAEFLQ